MTKILEDYRKCVRDGLLFGIGNPLLDIIAHVDESFLDQYGLSLNDAILAEEKHLNIFKQMEELYSPVEFMAGGSTQNTVRVAQWIFGHPKATVYSGCIGRDAYGSILRSKAEEQGVVTFYQENPTEPTGTCAVCVIGENRSMVARLGAANAFSEDHIDTDAMWGAIEKAQFYYSAGFFLTVSVNAPLKIAQHAQEKGKSFSTNLGAPFICEFFKEQLMQIMPYTNILFGNETEAEIFSKSMDFKTSDIKEIALKCANLPKSFAAPRLVVFSQADKPVIVAYDGKVTEYSVPPIDEALIVDTNGAGDAFAGGFMALHVMGAPVEECVSWGNYAARTVIQRSGCTFPANPSFQ